MSNINNPKDDDKDRDGKDIAQLDQAEAGDFGQTSGKTFLEAKTVETMGTSSSSASSPSSGLKSGCSESKEQHEHEHGHEHEHEDDDEHQHPHKHPHPHPQNSELVDDRDPSRVSWESGSVSMAPQASRVTIKLLVSNNMAGSIIGRAGQTVNDLQNRSSAKIRLSQSGDYFPGTSDRVCLIHGSLENVKKAIALVLRKLYELQLELVDTQLGHAAATAETRNDSKSDADECEVPLKINFTTKILVPSAACGMLIGREGGTIQRLKDNAGASSVRLSPKVVDHNIPRTFERVLTVSANELSACVSFTESILEGFVRHPETCRYLNGTTSYSRNTNFAMPRNSTSVLGHGHAYTNSSASVPNGGRPFAMSPVHDIDTGMQALGFDTSATVSSPHNQRPPHYIGPPPNASVTPSSSVFLPQAQIQRGTPPPQTSFASEKVAVPDPMVGAILGRRGRTLVELQSESGARVRVSQRNEFVPGTNNRIVTISGSPENIAAAKSMIRQLLSRNP